MSKKISQLGLLIVVLFGVVAMTAQTSQNQNQSISEKIKGKWEITSDPSDVTYHEVWKFDGTYLYIGSTKPGENVDQVTKKERYSIGNSCAASNPTANQSLSPDKFYLNVLESELCFEIAMGSKAKFMGLYYIGRGNHFSFKKIN